VAGFWDQHVAAWLAGDDPLADPLSRWFASFQGHGAGLVTREGFPEPYAGDLLGRVGVPRLVVLGLNPGVYHPRFQARDGIFADEIRQLGSYSAWMATSPYFRASWTTEMWGCIRGMRIPAVGGQVFEPAGGGVAVHPGAERVAQDRTDFAAVDGAVDRSGYRGWQRDEHDLAALAAHPQHAVAVLLTQVGDAGPARLEDPQPEQAAEHNDGGSSLAGVAGIGPAQGESFDHVRLSPMTRVPASPGSRVVRRVVDSLSRGVGVCR
jgi:hypothetical protein